MQESESESEIPIRYSSILYSCLYVVELDLLEVSVVCSVIYSKAL